MRSAGLALLVVCSVTANCTKDSVIKIAPQLSKEECDAIWKAQEFVADSGYTSRLAQADHVQRELWDGMLGPLERDLKRRQNSLKPSAVGIQDRTRSGKPGWTVAFEYTKEYLDQNRPPDLDPSVPLARGVSVFSDGQIRIEHPDLNLRAVTKTFSDPAAVAAHCGFSKRGSPLTESPKGPL